LRYTIAGLAQIGDKELSMRLYTGIAGFVLAVALTPQSGAQTVTISNEKLVSTTFVVARTNTMASCQGEGCVAKPVPMFKPIHVICPAAIDNSCTLNITLDAHAGINSDEDVLGDEGRYQFLVDGAAPVPGPTDGGFYTFSAYSGGFQSSFDTRQSYSASVVGRVINSRSKEHKIEVSVSCKDVSLLGGCSATTHYSTMRIDVFEP
jgi:hypothetical protein